MKFLFSDRCAVIARLLLPLCLAGGGAYGQTFVRPGDIIDIPLPIKNADDSGDTINSMKVIVTGDSAFVANPAESATQSIAPGNVKTFTPSFVVGSGQGLVDGQTYTVRLKMVSPDVGIDPDPDSPDSDTQVIYKIDLEGRPQVEVPDEPSKAGADVSPTGTDLVDGVNRVIVDGPDPFIDIDKTHPEPKTTLEVPLPCAIPGTYTVYFFDTLGHRSFPKTFECLPGPVATLEVNGVIQSTSGPLSRSHLEGRLIITAKTDICYVNIPADKLCDFTPQMSPGKCIINSSCDVFWRHIPVSTAGASSAGVGVKLKSTINIGGVEAPNFAQRVTVNFKVTEAPDERGIGAIAPDLEMQGGLADNALLEPGGGFTAAINIPSIGQDRARCSADGRGCVIGKTEIPEIDCRGPSAPEADAARAQGLYPVCGYGADDMVCDVTPSPAINSPALDFRTLCAEPPPEVDRTTARVCRFTGFFTWVCEETAAPGCGGDGKCNWGAPLDHSSTWGVFARLPSELPDRRGPALAGAQTSANGLSWADASQTVFSTMAHARVSVHDVGFSVERVSGVKVSTEPGPVQGVSGSVTRVHFDEGTGLFAAGAGVNINLTGGTWVAGRYGSAIRLNGARDQERHENS